MKREVWVLPCNFQGVATVYFGISSSGKNEGELRYFINKEGIAHSNGAANDGFASKLRDVVLVVEDCEGRTDTLPYYENDELDTATVKKYATRLIVGKKGDQYFRSVNIVQSK